MSDNGENSAEDSTRMKVEALKAEKRKLKAAITRQLNKESIFLSRVEGRESRVEGRGSRVEGRGSRVEGRGSRVYFTNVFATARKIIDVVCLL